LGRDKDGKWLKLQVLNGNAGDESQTGWGLIEHLQLNTSVSNVPVVTVSPTRSGVTVASSATATVSPPTERAGDPLVLAFYYMWYSPADFAKDQMSDQPVTPYDSTDPFVIERQVLEAKDAGIDAFITSWTGIATPTDANFEKLLEIAEARNFKATIYFETDSVIRNGDAAEQLTYTLNKYANHPAFLKWNGGKPVIFFWWPEALGDIPAWQELRQKVDPEREQIWSVDTIDKAYLDVFDGIHLFSGGKWRADTDVAKVNAQWRADIDAYNNVHGTNRIWAAGVIPGWDESRVIPQREGAKVFPRRDGALYEETWQAAISSRPEWVTITSFNEWFEGTQIEPSVTYGTRYLDLTRRYVEDLNSAQVPCNGGTTFPQTGFSICKQMEAYWQQYGGLPQFGYPISPWLSETNKDDGKTYTVQYFERARFELHPGNPPPYDVLLGSLGRQFHPADPPVPPKSTPGNQYFKETGHNVGPTFYSYWQQHGGLFVNGYPISEELQEKGSDGKTYTVQYFERARFELHPENPAPHNVLLGLLGRLAWEQRGR
jgi:hypothetical protein